MLIIFLGSFFQQTLSLEIRLFLAFQTLSPAGSLESLVLLDSIVIYVHRFSIPGNFYSLTFWLL